MTINSSSLNIHTFLNIAATVTGIIPTEDVLYVYVSGVYSSLGNINKKLLSSLAYFGH